LCATLEARKCRHIRCLRPNDDQAALSFDDNAMLRQCRYSGLMEATRIRRQGFPHRRALPSFAARYACLLRSRRARQEALAASPSHAEEVCLQICEVAYTCGVSSEHLRVGKTKVFLREPALTWLDAVRTEEASKLVLAALRGNAARSRFRRYLRAVVFAQALARGAIARRLTQQMVAETRAIEALLAAEAAAAAHEAAAQKVQQSWRKCLEGKAARKALESEKLAKQASKPKKQQPAQQQPALIWPQHRETRNARDTSKEKHRAHAERSDPISRSGGTAASPPPSRRGHHTARGGKKDATPSMSPSSDAPSAVPTPTRSRRGMPSASDGVQRDRATPRKVQLTWEPTTSRSAGGAHAAALEKAMSPRSVHRSYHQECLELLGRFQHLCQQLPTENQGLLSELSRASEFLTSTAPPIAAEDVQVIERCLQNAKVILESGLATGGGESRGGYTSLMEAPLSARAVPVCEGVWAAAGVNCSASTSIGSTTSAAGSSWSAAPWKLPTSHMSQAPISQRANLGASGKGSTPRLAGDTEAMQRSCSARAALGRAATSPRSFQPLHTTYSMQPLRTTYATAHAVAAAPSMSTRQRDCLEGIATVATTISASARSASASRATYATAAATATVQRLSSGSSSTTPSPAVPWPMRTEGSSFSTLSASTRSMSAQPALNRSSRGFTTALGTAWLLEGTSTSMGPSELTASASHHDLGAWAWRSLPVCAMPATATSATGLPATATVVSAQPACTSLPHWQLSGTTQVPIISATAVVATVTAACPSRAPTLSRSRAAASAPVLEAVGDLYLVQQPTVLTPSGGWRTAQSPVRMGTPRVFTRTLSPSVAAPAYALQPTAASQSRSLSWGAPVAIHATPSYRAATPRVAGTTPPRSARRLAPSASALRQQLSPPRAVLLASSGYSAGRLLSASSPPPRPSPVPELSPEASGPPSVVRRAASPLASPLQGSPSPLQWASPRRISAPLGVHGSPMQGSPSPLQASPRGDAPRSPSPQALPRRLR